MQNQLLATFSEKLTQIAKSTGMERRREKQEANEQMMTIESLL